LRTAGIDIGSRTVKLAVVEDGELVFSRVAENSFDPLAVCRALLEGQPHEAITATGYGRHLFAGKIGGRVITEIRAAAIGARHLFPGCDTVLDIGGQDTKAIALDADGRVGRFEMNDKCAAGTGRFLEGMAMALGATLDEFSELAGAGEPAAQGLNSTCAVFAESEAVGLIASGCPRAEIAARIVASIAGRAASLVRRVGGEGQVVFLGGVARCAPLRLALERRLDRPVRAPRAPRETQIAVALGCALLAGGD
jgi:predicted CoA-substrate-specific enzyme activase